MATQFFFYTYLSPKSTLTFTSHFGKKCDLGEGLIHCCNDWEQSESGIQALQKLKGMLFFVSTCFDGIKMSWGLILWRVCIAHADFIWEQEVMCITKARTGFGLQLQWAYIYVIYFNLCSYKFRGNILKHEMEGNKSKKNCRSSTLRSHLLMVNSLKKGFVLFQWVAQLNNREICLQAEISPFLCWYHIWKQ